jgi:glycosyltransferase involved in cell wall biosynthesis
MKNQSMAVSVSEKPKVRPKLAIVLRYPIQHFCPMYRSIAEDGRVDLLVVFCETGAVPRFDGGFGRVVQWQEDILEGYAHTVVTAPKAERSKAVLKELSKFAPDVVYVHGYDIDYMRATMHWARSKGIPVMMTTDSELLHPRPWYVRAMKSVVLPRVLRNVDMFLTVGDENERYHEKYKVPKSRFHRVPFSIDSSYYDKFLPGRVETRNALRQKLGISPDTVAILTVGKLIPRKEQAALVRAFGQALKSAKHPAVLLIAGDGAERAALEELAKPLGSAVRLLGFIGVDELPKYYLAADLYVHPSSFDPHPLAISEALYCGLPVVVSDRIGSTGPTDDVQVNRNGWVYPNGDVNALSAILSKVIDDSTMRKDAGAISAELGQLHSAKRCGTLFVDGTLRAFAGRPHNANHDGR